MDDMSSCGTFGRDILVNERDGSPQNGRNVGENV